MNNPNVRPSFVPYHPGWMPQPPSRPVDRHLKIRRHDGVTRIFLQLNEDKLVVNNMIVNTIQHPQQLDHKKTSGKTCITGTDLFMTGDRWGNAAIVDALLYQPEYFPEKWKIRKDNGEIIFFFAPGTIYGAESINPHNKNIVIHFVRGVYWEDDAVREVTHALDSPWYNDAYLMVTL